MKEKEFNYFDRQREMKEKEFLEHVNEVCAFCKECRNIKFKKKMVEIATGSRGEIHYICSDCDDTFP
jgi:hypothetical protein